jgi:LCP family protein required for cell wall assembly
VPPALRRRRGLRIALLSVAAFVLLAGAAVGGGFLFVNHLTGSIQRIPVRFTRLDAASRPAGGYDSYGGAMTVLITGEGIGPTGDPGPPGPSDSGLIMLLHVNAEGYSGGVVSIPPQAVVWVPGHGRTAIQNALTCGGPSLLVQKVQQFTQVQIDHSARIDFNHVDNVVNVMGGVDVRLPDGELEQLAMQVRALTGSADYVTAPVHIAGGQVYLDSAISDQLWAAIRQDAITAFAEKYPFTVTPAAPR